MALVLLITTLAIHSVSSNQDIPYCIKTCLTEVGTTLCDTQALRDLTPCLTKTCLNPLVIQDLIASLNISFNPKAEYSCQQVYEPSTSETSIVTLSLNGTCATSPYEYKSYLPQGVSSMRASVGCEIITFSDEDCLGVAGSSDLGTLSDGKCVFRGGRSARLSCRNEIDAVRAYMQTYCGTDVGDDDEPDNCSAISKTIYPSSTLSHDPAPSSPGTGSPSSILFHWPFISNSSSANAASSMPFTVSSIPFHWSHRFFPSRSGSPTVYKSSPTTTDIVDAAGQSRTAVVDIATMYGSIPASISASATSFGDFLISNDSDRNGNSNSSSGGSLNATYATSIAPTADPTTPPLYAGLAAQLSIDTKSAVAVALFAAVFALFL